MIRDHRGQVRAGLRSTGALIMLGFVICHFGNHILLLVSIPTAIAAHHFLIDPWRTVIGTTILLSGFAAHYGNALWSIYVRREFRLTRWGWWQLCLGLLVPLLLCLHLSETRIQEIQGEYAANYTTVFVRQWAVAPWMGILQVILLCTVWTHAMIGIHFWWRNKRWYKRWRTALAVFALLWPSLALAGYTAGGNEILRLAEQPGFVDQVLNQADIDEESLEAAHDVALEIAISHVILVTAAFAARIVRRQLALRRYPATLSHSNGRNVPILAGATLLEILLANDIAHAWVCGGRARCTTCRVRVLKGGEALPPPTAIEARALARIGAPAGVRLACQIHPTADIAIAPLLAPLSLAEDGHTRAGFAGHEQFVTVMFVDLRGSTALGEARLPYDVLFLLDTFFGEMAASLAATRGHFSQFTGDGLMALYGLDEADAGTAVRAALRCAADMLTRLDRLNRRLLPDLAQPLRIGIGIHHGQAIVGPLGPPGSQILTAIGDTVNTTARLEGLSKIHDGAIIVSRYATDAAGLDISGATLRSTALAGRSEPVEYYAFAELPKMG